MTIFNQMTIEDIVKATAAQQFQTRLLETQVQQKLLELMQLPHKLYGATVSYDHVRGCWSCKTTDFVEGFGASPKLACEAFDKVWNDG